MTRVQKATLTLVGLVLAIDALAIGAYFLFDLARASEQVRLGFVAAWTGVTLVVVLTQIRRIREAQAERMKQQ